MNYDTIPWVRKKMPEKLAREMFWQAAQYFKPLGLLVGLWHTLETSKNLDERLQAVKKYLHIKRYVDWKEADGFCVLLDGFILWLEENPLQLPASEIKAIAECAVDVAGNSTEMIQDGDNWQASAQELQTLIEGFDAPIQV